MAKFPGEIQYLDIQAPRYGPNATINPETRTGAGMVAQAIGGLGGALSEIDQKIQLAEDTMELSTLNRKRDEIAVAGFAQMEETQDPAAIDAIYQKMVTDAGALGSKKSRVNDLYIQNLNKDVPLWEANYRDVSRRKKILRIRDEKKINDQADYESGTPKSKDRFIGRQHQIEMLGDQTPEMTADLIKNFDNESILARMNKAAEERNFGVVSTLAEQLKDPSSDQLKRKNTILKAVEQMQGDAGDAFQKAILKEAIDADAANMDALSRSNLAADMKKRIAAPNNGLSGEQARALMNWVDNWSSAGDVETNWPSYQKVRQLVGPVARGETKLDDALKTYYAESQNLGKQERKELLEKLISASEEKTKEPEKDPIFARGMSTLNDFETRKFFGPPDDEAVKKLIPPDEYDKYAELSEPGKELYRNNLSTKKLFEVQNAYEKWAKENPTASIADHEKWIDDVMKLPKTEIAKSRLRDWINAAARLVPWGGTRPAPRVGPLQPIKLDLATAKKYLFLAGGDRARAEKLAKQDGYEW